MRIRVFAFLAVLFSTSLLIAEDAVDTAYQQIHTRVCTEMRVDPCPQLTDADDKWAYVATWCDRIGDKTICAPLAGLADERPIVIAFNHDTQSWRPIQGISEENIELNLEGQATVLTYRGRKVIPVIESTNPLLYSATVGALTETAAPVVAELKEFLKGLVDAATTAMALAADALIDDERTTITAADDAIKQVECVTDQWTRAREFAEDVEYRRRDGNYKLLATCNNFTTIDDAFRTVETTVNDLDTIPSFCTTEATALAALLDMPPEDLKALQDKRKTISIPISCESRLDETRGVVDELLNDLAQAPNAAALDAARTRWRTISVQRRNQLAGLAETAAEVAALKAGAAKILGEKKEEIRGVASDVRKFEERLMANVATTATKTPAEPVKVAEVADFFVVSGPITTGLGENVRSRTVTVSKAAPFDTVDTRRGDAVATKYSSGSLFTSEVDVHAALTHTQLSSPVFGVVSVPAPTEANPNATKTVIARKDEEERSGKIALFVSLPLFLLAKPDSDWARNLGVDIGSGVGDKPALFLGLSWRINRLIRLGAGSTWQQVDALDGQTIGQDAAEADIKRKNVIDGSWYASLSISIAGIDLFDND